MEAIFARKLKWRINWLNDPVLNCWFTGKLQKSLFTYWVHSVFILLLERKPGKDIFNKNIKLMIMWPLRFSHNFLFFILVSISLFISPLVVRILFTVINETAIVIITVFKIVIFVLWKVVLLNICLNLIFGILRFFPLFNESNNNTDNALPEVFIDVLKNFLVKQFMILKEEFHFILRVLFL